MVYCKKEERNYAIAMMTAVYVLRWNTCAVALINHRAGKIIALKQNLFHRLKLQ
jgi:hypothetical protein